MSNRALAFWTQKVESQMDLTPCDGCDSCGIRCTAGVPMSQAEHTAVQDFIAGSENAAYIDSVTMQDKRLDLGDGVTQQMCRFRDMEQGSCAIYPARPLMCRLMGHLEWMPCPIEKVTRRPQTHDALTLMQAYAGVDRKPLEMMYQSPKPST